MAAHDESTSVSHIKEGHEEEVPSTTSNAEECVLGKAVKSLPLFNCDECTFLTRTEKNVKEHKEKKHGEEVEKEIMCTCIPVFLVSLKQMNMMI